MLGLLSYQYLLTACVVADVDDFEASVSDRFCRTASW